MCPALLLPLLQLTIVLSLLLLFSVLPMPRAAPTAPCFPSWQQLLLCLLQLANVLSTEALFYTCILPFIAFFGSFAFILYPLRDVLHPHGEPDCRLLIPPGTGPAGVRLQWEWQDCLQLRPA